MKKPIWTPYNPDDCVGDFGWLWDDDAGEWLLCATVEPDGIDAELVLVFPSRSQVGEDWHCNPEDWRGDPYLSCSAPTIEPGECDGLEVAIRFEGGASAVHAIGQDERVQEILEGINAVLLPGGVWCPIDEAPRDGRSFLAYWPTPALCPDAWNICRTWWDEGRTVWATPDAECAEDDPDAPTFWLPGLPPLPDGRERDTGPAWGRTR